MHHSLLVLSLAACISVHALAQGEVEPRTNAKKGGSVWFVQELVTEASLQFQGQDMKTKQVTKRALHVQVVDVDQDGNLMVAARIARVHGDVVMAAGQGEFAFDSAATEDDGGAPGNMRKGMLIGAGMQFHAKVSPAGAVLELGEGAEAIVTAAKEGSSLHKLDRSGLQQLVRGAFGLLPPKRTAGGAQWEQQVDCTMGGAPLAAKGKFVLTQVDPDWFEIEASGTVALELQNLARYGSENEDAELKRQLESSKFSNTSFQTRQKTSRKDGFVASGTETIEFDVEIGDSMMGAGSSHMKIVTSWRRTTEAEAMPAKASEAAAPKKQ
ncbi:MAG: hypothetical protein MUC36_27855 [Planctomycetes bacterium]|jgi:hypothetical protein|nr:hypothetical protein [Planctomycetota bacterium]